MSNTPSFVETARRRAEAVQRSLPPLAPTSHQDDGNPFQAAADALTDRWNDMVARVHEAEKTAAEHREQNIWLAGEVDRLNRELDARIESDNQYIAELKQAADRAVDDSVSLRGKVTLVADAIETILRGPQPAPEHQLKIEIEPPFEPSREPIEPPPEDWRPNRDITHSRIVDPGFTHPSPTTQSTGYIPQNAYRQ